MADNQWDDEARNPNELHFEGRSRDPQEAAQGSAGPPKAGMSGGMKAFLIVVAILGTCLLLCCGGSALLSYFWLPKESTDPAQINVARDAIARINLPAEFKPARMFKINNFMTSITIVSYQNASVHGDITLLEMNVKLGGLKANEQIQSQMQQLERQGFAEHIRLINVNSTTKTIKINGRDCVFEFLEGEDPATKTKRHQIAGVFAGRHGPVLVSINMDDSAYHEDEIVKMLQTIQ
jgi:hypothetical protein